MSTLKEIIGSLTIAASLAWGGMTLIHNVPEPIDGPVRTIQDDETVTMYFGQTTRRSASIDVTFASRDAYDAYARLAVDLERDYQRGAFDDDVHLQLTQLVDDPSLSGSTITLDEVLAARQLYNRQGKDAFDLRFPVEYAESHQSHTRPSHSQQSSSSSRSSQPSTYHPPSRSPSTPYTRPSDHGPIPSHWQAGPGVNYRGQ